MNYHLNKAIKKGYKPAVYDTIRINTVDSFPVIVHDSIVWEKYVTQKDTLIQIRTEYVPKPRYIERFDLKRFNDSLKHIRTIYSDSLQNALRTHKNKQETDLKNQRVNKGKTFTDTMKFTAVSLFLLLLILIFFKLSKYLGLNELK
jgi:lipase chaperone LimK